MAICNKRSNNLSAFCSPNGRLIDVLVRFAKVSILLSIDAVVYLIPHLSAIHFIISPILVPAPDKAGRFILVVIAFLYASRAEQLIIGVSGFGGSLKDGLSR